MTQNVYTKFYHRWEWDGEKYSKPTLLVRDLISSRVTAGTGKNFRYQKTLVYTTRKSDAVYQRLEDTMIMALDPVTISLIASLVAGVLLAIASAVRGQPVGFEVGVDPETKEWYVKTGNHEVVGDGGGSVPINPDLPSQTQSGGDTTWILAIVAGLMLLFFLWK